MKERLVHSDLKPDNILISDINTPWPIVKLGDLGTGGYLPNRSGCGASSLVVLPEVFNEWPAQNYAMRSPEVHAGFGCSHRSDIWSPAVTVLDWLRPGIFGVADNKDSHWPDAWSIAKLMRLFPNWEGCTNNNDAVQKLFDLARVLSTEPDPKNPDELNMKTPVLEKELEAIDAPPELLGMARLLLGIDIGKRPSAAEAMKS